MLILVWTIVLSVVFCAIMIDDERQPLSEFRPEQQDGAIRCQAGHVGDLVVCGDLHLCEHGHMYNTQQHAASHCNKTLQHIATRLNLTLNCDRFGVLSSH